MKQSAFIEEVKQQCLNQIQTAEKHLSKGIDSLTKRPNENAWNAIECYEHLNLYYEIYIQTFQEAFNRAKILKSEKEIKRGFWGNKFIEMMEPKSDKIKKMKTFDSKNTLNQSLDINSLHRFINYNNQVISLIEKNANKDVQSVKCKLTVPLLKMKLSDTIQFILSHNHRHIQQADRAINL